MLFAQASQSVGHADAAYDAHTPGEQYYSLKRPVRDALRSRQIPGKCAEPVRGIVWLAEQMPGDNPRALSAPAWVWLHTACGCGRRGTLRTAGPVRSIGVQQTYQAPQLASAWPGRAETTRRNSDA